MASQWLGNALDWLGTKTLSNEHGWSELLAGGRPTTNTGVQQPWFSTPTNYVPYSPNTFTPNVPTDVYHQSGGSILGVNTNQPNNNNNIKATTTTIPVDNGSGGGGTSGDGGGTQPPQPSYQDLVNQYYDQLINALPGREQSEKDAVGNSANTQIQGMNDYLASREPGYETDRNSTRRRGAKTLADLAGDLRDSSRNIGNYLGAKGSVSPSANQNVAYALSKEFGKNRADVRGQVSDQLGQIDKAEQQLKTEVGMKIADIKSWKAEQVRQITNAYNQYRNNLDYGKANQMLDYLKQIEAQSRSLTEKLTLSAQQRLADLNNAKIELNKTGNFSPTNIVKNEFRFNPQSNTNIDDIVNYIYGRKRQESM